MSWLSSNLIKGNVRERTIITLSGIAPDIDGLGLIIDPVMKLLSHTTNYWGQFHHSLHTLVFALVVTAASFFIAKVNKFKVACLSLAVFHLHLLCDIIGSRGPDGYQWPIPYLAPFSDKINITWQYQWELNAWPNILIGIALLAVSALIAKVHGRSPFEIVSEKANDAFVQLMVKLT